uniref:Myosin_tail_1 domain-containing protein n=1 Tax=Ascaris lumbricoides TaxID=6252 RepID=A0A0M3HKQ2_ASCLU
MSCHPFIAPRSEIIECICNTKLFRNTVMLVAITNSDTLLQRPRSSSAILSTFVGRHYNGGIFSRGRIGQDIKVDTSKDSAKEIAALQNYLDEEQERLVDIRRSIQQLEKRLNSVKTDYDRVKRNEQNLKTDIGPLEEKIEGLEKRLKEQKVRAKEAAADERAVEKAKQKVAELEKG